MPLTLPAFRILSPQQRSLRQKLLFSLTAFSVLLFLLLGYSAYRIALEETQEILDQQMKEMAYFLAETSIDHLDSAFRPNHRYDETDVFIDIWTYPSAHASQRKQVLREDPDRIRLPRMAQPQFQQVHSSRGELKVFVLPLPDRQIQISQQLKVRRHLAQELALSMLIPYVLLVPFLVLGLGLLIRRLFKPVDALQRTIASRNHGDLTQIDTRHLPLEIKPAIDEFNQLFQRIEQAQQQQQQFIADAAHELRSPITALNLQLKVLQKTLPAELTQDRNFASLTQGLQRIQHLVLQMMTLAHQETQSASPQPLTDLVVQVHFVIEQLMLSARKKQIELGLDSRITQLQVAADPVQLQSILFNMIDNAIKYTPVGGEIAICLTQDAHRVYLSIEDSGPGVAATDYPKLTERFVRLPQTHQDIVGSGLGLAIVKNAVQHLGGSLEFSQSVRLGGLMVKVSLPY
ncbi:sensor histidine kinase [Alkanindiges illinoisensis]|uniref:histidine kinase n=1 Tax=Alkanindiges illinoisensis TaxID=197183 RepID=A0A4Y7X9D2_9GAMM|nr:ATP-binding protein [Alkanindiges illinoisensis]TEU24175.1 two-component sensor histidine kinase [Alkanindiges illinoisensis]